MELVSIKFHLGSYIHLSHQLQVSTIVKYFMNGESELGVGSTFTLRLPADMKSHLEKPHVLKASNLFIRDILSLK